METCHVTNQLNAHLDDLDREEMLAEYRDSIELDIKTTVIDQIIMCINLENMTVLEHLCQDYNMDFDSVCSLLMREEQEMFTNCFIRRKECYSEAEARIMAEITVTYFDFESAIDAEIERRDMAAGEPNE